MDFRDISKKRMTVRKFDQRPVEKEKADLILEAASIDLGTVWISYFDKDKACDLLNIPENYEILCMLYIGYQAKDFKPNPVMSGKRFPIEHTCFDNDYSIPYKTDFFEEAPCNPFENNN